MSAEDNLKKLGITLPQVSIPAANFLPFRLHHDTLYVSGQGPRLPSGGFSKGIVGRDVDIARAYQDARTAGLGLLAVARHALGTLDRIEFAVKLLGMVNAEPGFSDQPKVINGCSDLFVEILGEAGRHARSAVGMGSLPNNMTVEIEAIFAVKQ